MGHPHLGAFALGELAKRGPAQSLVPPTMAHDFAYMPDIARAAVALPDAPDAFGRKVPAGRGAGGPTGRA